MKIDVLAYTVLNWDVMEEAYDYDAYGEDIFPGCTSADALAESAGRLCYRSFNRPNPKTALNKDYLKNIIDHEHFSVLEHSSVTFLIRGVSRSLLTELTRHRHLSFSVVSQRYCDYSETEPVIPPALEGVPAGENQVMTPEEVLREAYWDSLAAYLDLTIRLQEQGLPRKQAREAARSVLPNAAPVDLIVTGNIRAWRDVLGKRWHVAADAEVRRLAGLILMHLRDICPASVQDIPEKPYGTENSI